MKITPENITELKPNEIFVYGSNNRGIHGRGAAKTALKWGAVIGKSDLQGQTYGIDTCNYNQHGNPKVTPLTLDKIEKNIIKFIEFAITRPDLEFLVTKVGCGLAFYSVEDIGPLFKDKKIPLNVSLPIEFWRYNLTNKLPMV